MIAETADTSSVDDAAESDDTGMPTALMPATPPAPRSSIPPRTPPLTTPTPVTKRRHRACRRGSRGDRRSRRHRAADAATEEADEASDTEPADAATEETEEAADPEPATDDADEADDGDASDDADDGDDSDDADEADDGDDSDDGDQGNNGNNGIGHALGLGIDRTRPDQPAWTVNPPGPPGPIDPPSRPGPDPSTRRPARAPGPPSPIDPPHLLVLPARCGSTSPAAAADQPSSNPGDGSGSAASVRPTIEHMFDTLNPEQQTAVDHVGSPSSSSQERAPGRQNPLANGRPDSGRSADPPSPAATTHGPPQKLRRVAASGRAAHRRSVGEGSTGQQPVLRTFRTPDCRRPPP